MATKKKILYIVEAMGGGVFTYIVDLANELVDTYDMYIAYKTEKVEHPFTVYTLGRICYQKKPTLFNEIAGSFPNVKFVWIGDGELRGELTSKNIEITGWADRSTAIRYAVNQKQAKTLWKAAHFKVTRLRAFTRMQRLKY